MAILRRVAVRVPRGSSWRDRLNAAISGHSEVGIHLAVCVEPFLEAILDGRKTIESRFSIHRCTPFEKVQRGDIIMLKRSGGPVVGLALAGDASYYELTEYVLDDLRNRFATQLYAEDDDFWTARAEKRFASLIKIDGTVKIESMAVEKRDRRGWVTYVDSQQLCIALTN